jgi:hypothetical protein
MNPGITVNQETVEIFQQIVTRSTVSGVGRPGGASIFH